MNLEKYGIPTVDPIEAAKLIGTGILVGGLAMKAYMNSILRDRGHTQLVVPETHASAMLEIFEANGAGPRRRIVQGDEQDPTTVQAMMGKGGETVLLRSDEEALDRMGNPTCGKTFVSKNPLGDAQAAAEVFGEHGIPARVDTTVHDETGDPIFHVIAEGSSIALGWRLHGKDMPGPMPPRWQTGDTL